ncbi:legumain [Trichonephila clavipes]|nr:legumain [Trichonephila clavipes]
MLNELYVDGLINSTSDTTEALQLSKEMIHILSEAGMNLRKWATNSTTQFEKLKNSKKADICHSYQILKNHGFTDERIILLITDDIANNGENLTPVVVINHPNGNNFYKGVSKDYTDEDVTPKNFMAVLKGDEKTLAGVGSEKVAQVITYLYNSLTRSYCFPRRRTFCNGFKSNNKQTRTEKTT